MTEKALDTGKAVALAEELGWGTSQGSDMEAFDGLFETLILYCPMPWLEPEESKDNHAAMIETFAA